MQKARYFYHFDGGLFVYVRAAMNRVWRAMAASRAAMAAVLAAVLCTVGVSATTPSPPPTPTLLSPPPTTLPPPPPALTADQYVFSVEVSFNASGDVSDYDVASQQLVLGVLASAMNVSTDGATISIMAASVRVTATFPVISREAAVEAQGQLVSALSDSNAFEQRLAYFSPNGTVPFQLQSAMSVQVVAAPVEATVTPEPTPTAPSELQPSPQPSPAWRGEDALDSFPASLDSTVLCLGMAPSDYCDCQSPGDCTDNPTWCSCAAAQRCCGASSTTSTPPTLRA